MTVILSLLIALWFHASANRPPQDTNQLAKGVLIEKVTCRDNPNESYALYLPSNYDSSRRKWPILYAFDPGARGKTPVEHYRDAAEKFGWIIVGSNNSRNGTWQSSIDAWNAITGDTEQRLAIDNARSYATGFSGGARVAALIATQCHDCLAGVIASGAGFPSGVEPASTMHFDIFTTTGVDDFNFPEVRSLDDKLTRAGIAHATEVFAGRHEWPPSDVAMRAVAWMELRAMKAGARNRDSRLVDELWDAQIKQARSLEDAKRFYDAYQIYLQMNGSYQGLHDSSEVDTKLNQLRNIREVRDATRDEQEQIRRQRELESQLANLIGARLNASAAQQNLNDERPGDEEISADMRLHDLLAQLRRQSNATQDSGTRRIARRVLEGEFIGLFEQGSSLLQIQKHYGEAARIFGLAGEIHPDRAGAFYYLAWAYAAGGEKKKALEALKTAIEKGFLDRAALNDNKAFDSIRTDQEFQKLIGSIK